MSRCPLLAVPFVALLAALPCSAADPDDLAALKKRLDKLETENAALKKELADVKQALAPWLKVPKESVEKVGTEEKIKAFGKELAEDLVHGRLAAVYDATSANYRKTTDRKMFEELMKKDGAFKVLTATAGEKAAEATRVKAGAKKAWNWYYTRTVSAGFSTYRVNVAAAFVEEDGDWKIDALDLRRDDS